MIKNKNKDKIKNEMKNKIKNKQKNKMKDALESEMKKAQSFILFNFILIFLILFFINHSFNVYASNDGVFNKSNLEKNSIENEDVFSKFVDTGKTEADEESENVSLKNWYADIKILENGNLKITEIWDAKYRGDITTMYRSFGRGVLKDNVLSPKVYKLNNKVDFNNIDIEKEKEASKVFSEVPFKEKQSFGNYHLGVYEGRLEIGWGIDKDKKEDVYLFEYELNGASVLNKDSSEIFHRFIDKNSINTDKLMLRIGHETKMLEKEKTAFFGHGSDNLNIRYEGGKIYAQSLGTFPLGQMCEYRLVMPKSFLNDASRNREIDVHEIWNIEKKIYDTFITAKIKEVEKYEKSINLSTISYIVFIAASLNCICYLIFKIIKYKKINNLRMEKVKKFKYYTEVPEDIDLDIMKIIFFKCGTPDTYNLSQILQTVVLKAIYLKILEINEEAGKDRKGIFKQEKKLVYKINEEKYNEEILKNTLSEFEKEVIKLFIKSKDENGLAYQEKINAKLETSLDTLYKSYTKDIADKKEELKKNGYIREEKEEKTKNKLEANHLKSIYLLILIFGIIFTLLIIFEASYKGIDAYNIFRIINLKYSIALINISFILTLISMGLKHRSLSTKGLQAQNELKGFKKHLTDFSLMNERDEKEIIIWEKILIYATFFGISKKVLKHLKKINPEIYNEINRNWYLTSFYSGAFTPSSIASISAGSGGYGGFSSGGSFGGGGFGGGSGGGR